MLNFIEKAVFTVAILTAVFFCMKSCDHPVVDKPASAVYFEKSRLEGEMFFSPVSSPPVNGFPVNEKRLH